MPFIFERIGALLLKASWRLLSPQEKKSFVDGQVKSRGLVSVKNYLLRRADKDWMNIEESDQFKSIYRQVRELFPLDYNRIFLFYTQLRRIEAEGLAGHIAELGVYKGFSAKLINICSPDRTLHLFDTFEGQPDNSVPEVDGSEYHEVVQRVKLNDTSLEAVKNLLGGSQNIKYYKGYFPKTAEPLNGITYCFVHLDGDQYQTILDGLIYFYPRLCLNGAIIIHDFGIYKGVRRAVEEYLSQVDNPPVLVQWPDAQGSALLIKNGDK